MEFPSATTQSFCFVNSVLLKETLQTQLFHASNKGGSDTSPRLHKGAPCWLFLEARKLI